MTGQRVGSRRVSTIDQNTARQLDSLTLDKIFEDKASGKDTLRPQLQAALEYCRECDTLVVHSMNRLARSLIDLRKIVGDLPQAARCRIREGKPAFHRRGFPDVYPFVVALRRGR